MTHVTDQHVQNIVRSRILFVLQTITLLITQQQILHMRPRLLHILQYAHTHTDFTLQ